MKNGIFSFSTGAGFLPQQYGLGGARSLKYVCWKNSRSFVSALVVDWKMLCHLLNPQIVPIKKHHKKRLKPEACPKRVGLSANCFESKLFLLSDEFFNKFNRNIRNNIQTAWKTKIVWTSFHVQDPGVPYV